MKARIAFGALVLVSVFACSGHPKKEATPPLPDPGVSLLRVQQSPEDRKRSEAHGGRAIISTQGVAATRAAREILGEGGNIIDAALAASFTISVERPHSTGLGGGGFLLYRDAATGKVHTLDFRERAPLKATRDMFLDKAGNVVPDASLTGILAVGVPGFLRGMLELHSKWGKLSLKQILAPAIQLAETGLVVYPSLAKAFKEEAANLAKFPNTRAIFLHPNGTPYKEGEKLIQKNLARTLRALAQSPQDALKKIERKFVVESLKQGGLLTHEDFARYKVKYRDPVRGTFRGYEIVSMPPPSSGGTHVIEILNILEGFPLKSLGLGSPQTIHRIASAEQLAFADRAEYMGDPDFVTVPTEKLISKGYADRQRARIDLQKHTPSSEIKPGDVIEPDHVSTTHFSIMDDAGNVVASTQTINGYFGSAVTAGDSGILLNNEMDDFVAKPGVPNMFGAVGGDANAIAPGKTPLSSMSPTIVLKDGQPIMAVGAPGGTRIISCVTEAILNHLEMGMPLYESVASFRVHHQWKPDELAIDMPGPGEDAIERLKSMGYVIKLAPRAVSCNTMAVARDGAGLVGVSEPADAGSSLGM